MLPAIESLVASWASVRIRHNPDQYMSSLL